MKNKNTILIIFCLFAIAFNIIFSAGQRKKYAGEIVKSNIEVIKSNDSLITAIKQLNK